MFKKIGALITTILGLVLLVYSAARSLDFITLTLPADRQILAYFGLAALDGGLLAWLLAYLYGSRGGWQRAISILMVIVDTIGAVIMFTLDTLFNTGKAGMTAAMSQDTLQTAVLALSGIIALNIVSVIAHHLTDPDKLREQAEEEAFAKVEDATLRQISENANQLAAEVAPMLAVDWMQNSRARYLANLGTGRIPVIDVKAQDLPARAPKKDLTPANLTALWAGLPWVTGKNGNGKYHAEVEAVKPADPFEGKEQNENT
ncbi:MAG TPA: hypothetical protein VGK00_06145 [Anaerolineales bacterium]|jgi:hypothetical protein